MITHRIGDLEKRQHELWNQRQITHRIGDLEIQTMQMI